MIVFTIIGVICVLYVAALMVMAWRDNRKLRKHRARTVPLEEYSPLPRSRFAPYVPPQWQRQPSDDDPGDTPPV